MHKCKWKKKYGKGLYKPMKAKVVRFGPSNNNPHAQFRVVETTKQEQAKGLGLYKATGCTCNGCLAYLREIAKLNPSRFIDMVTPEESTFFRNTGLPEHVHVRRLLAYSIGNWRS